MKANSPLSVTSATTPARGISVGRQTHLVAGLMLWTAIALALTVDLRWILLAALPAFGMLLDAATGVCPMTLLLKRAPWNSGR